MISEPLADVIETYSNAIEGLKQFQNVVRERESIQPIQPEKTTNIIKHFSRLIGQLQITIYHYIEYKKLSSFIAYLYENGDIFDNENFKHGREMLERGQLYPDKLNIFTILKFNYMKNSYTNSYMNSVGASCDIMIAVANFFYHSWSSIHSILKFHARYLNQDSNITVWKAIKKALLNECMQNNIKLHDEILKFTFNDNFEPKKWLMTLRALRDEISHCKRLDNGFRSISNGEIFNNSKIIFSPDSRSEIEEVNEIELSDLLSQLNHQYDSFFINSLKHYGNIEFQKHVWRSYLT